MKLNFRKHLDENLKWYFLGFIILFEIPPIIYMYLNDIRIDLNGGYTTLLVFSCLLLFIIFTRNK